MGRRGRRSLLPGPSHILDSSVKRRRRRVDGGIEKVRRGSGLGRLPYPVLPMVSVAGLYFLLIAKFGKINIGYLGVIFG